MNNLTSFNYSNVQRYQHGGNKTTRKVIIRKGKGHKSISFYKKGKLVKTIKRPLLSTHIDMIKNKQFIPGLFTDCKTRKHK